MLGMGLFQFQKLPYGLSEALATFQRMLDSLISHEFALNAFASLDDIIIVNATFEEHVDLVKRILAPIKSAGLEINFKKWHFCVPEV